MSMGSHVAVKKPPEQTCRARFIEHTLKLPMNSTEARLKHRDRGTPSFDNGW